MSALRECACDETGANLLIEGSKGIKIGLMKARSAQGDDNDGTCNPRYQGPSDRERRTGRQAFGRDQDSRGADDRSRAGDDAVSGRASVRVLGARGAAALDEPDRAGLTRKVVSCQKADTVAAIMEMMTSG